MIESCEREIVDLHRFFVAWMTGSLPRTETAFSRFTDALEHDFVIISPRGLVTDRSALIGELEAAHGVRAGDDVDFRIWIESPRIRRLAGENCLATYEEWQHAGGETTGRLSSALFAPRVGAPNGVVWLHVHETWLPGRTPA